MKSMCPPVNEKAHRLIDQAQSSVNKLDELTQALKLLFHELGEALAISVRIYWNVELGICCKSSLAIDNDVPMWAELRLSAENPWA